MTSMQVDDDTAEVLQEMATAHHMTLVEFLRSIATRGVATTPSGPATDFDEELEPLLLTARPCPRISHVLTSIETKADAVSR